MLALSFLILTLLCSLANGACECKLFEHTNYGGKSKCFDVGNHSSMPSGYNDIFSSVQVVSEYY